MKKINESKWKRLQVQYIDEPKRASLLSFDVLVSLVLLVVTLLAFKSATTEHLSGEDAQRLGPYKFFMLAMVCISFLIFIMNAARISRDNLFLWFAVSYVFVAIFSTFASDLYPISTLPFRFIRLSYWAWVLIISYYSVLRLNTFKFHIAVVILLLPILFYFFFTTMNAYRGGSSISTLVLNPVFYISFLMPVVLLLRSKILKISGLLLIFAAILISYKRSAMIAFITAIPVYFYALLNSGSNAKLKKLIPIVVGGTILLLLLALSFNFISSAVGLDWGGRLESMSSDRGSGRLDIWASYARLLGSQSPYHWIMGHGHYATEFTSYGWPHNDILEVLYDFGLVGLTFYLLFISQLAKIFFDMKKCKYKHFDAFAVSLVIFFWGTMVSMLIVVPYWFLNLSFFWGWIIADFHNAKRYGDPEKIGNPLYAYAYEYEDGYEEGYEEYSA